MAVHLTDQAVRALAAPAGGNRITYDSELRGFGARVTAADARSFVLNYRTRDGRERRHTIGTFPAWSAKQARVRAAELKREVEDGADPMGRRQADREAPTVADLAKLYLEDAATRKRPRTLKEDQSLLAGAILPRLGKIKVAELHRSEIERAFRDVSKAAPIRANRMLSLLRAMLNKAEVWELRSGKNPATAITRNPETKRDRYLTGEEVGRLLAAVAAHRNQQSANIIRLALLTGARRGEILQAKWDQLDFERGTWSKPASMTKQKKLHVIPLNGPAIQLLASMKTEADTENAKRVRDGFPPIGHLFPGSGQNETQGDLKRTWASVCKSAGIEGLRFHDLRHAFASFLVSSGHNLPLIGQLLGHSSTQTTARYAHLLLDPQREAAERVGSIIMGTDQPVTELVVLPLQGRP